MAKPEPVMIQITPTLRLVVAVDDSQKVYHVLEDMTGLNAMGGETWINQLGVIQQCGDPHLHRIECCSNKLTSTTNIDLPTWARQPTGQKWR